MQTSIDLLSNASATGAVKSVAYGGRYIMLVQGTFSGATVSVEILGPDGTNYVTVPDSSKTVAGAAVIYLPAGATVRGAVANGPPTGIYLALHLTERNGG